jgi:hypothetical protein
MRGSARGGGAMTPPADRRSPKRVVGLQPPPPATLQPPTQQLRTSRLATPVSRMLLAGFFVLAIWLPSLLLTHGTDPKILVVNAVFTGASLLVLTPRRHRRTRRSARQDTPPHR